MRGRRALRHPRFQLPATPAEPVAETAPVVTAKPVEPVEPAAEAVPAPADEPAEPADAPAPAEPEKKEQEPPEKEESRETSRPVRAESPEQKKTPENAPEKTQGSDRRQSVLQALRERKAKLKPRENQEPERKTQTHKKGEQALG